jgi:hypothetical protein
MTELEAQKRLLAMGVNVLTPLGAGTPFDLVVHINGRYSKVQIKTGWEVERGALRFLARKGAQREGLTHEDCDVILVYHRETDIFYIAAPNGKPERYISAKNLLDAQFNCVGQLFPETMVPPRKTTGVGYSKRMNRWTVRVRDNGKEIQYGSYPTYDEAVMVAEKAKALLKNKTELAA